MTKGKRYLLTGRPMSIRKEDPSLRGIEAISLSLFQTHRLPHYVRNDEKTLNSHITILAKKHTPISIILFEMKIMQQYF